MKSTLFLILIAFSTSLSAQTYFHFPDSNAVWSVYDHKYFVNGDTVYNSLNYKKYYDLFDSVYNPANGVLYALLREDTIAKKVYAVNLNTGNENLLYDFSLSVNDSVTVYPYWLMIFGNPTTVKVDSIDSVNVAGQYRKRFKMTMYPFGFSLYEYWIEGIGSTFGPFNSGLSGYMITDVFYPVLICYEQDSVLMYHDQNYTGCYAPEPMSINENRNDYRISVYPNPFKSKLICKINKQDFKTLKFTILDLSGRNVYDSGSLPDFTSDKFEINLEFLSKGIYILKTEADGVTAMLKIVKQ